MTGPTPCPSCGTPLSTPFVEPHEASDIRFCSVCQLPLILVAGKYRLKERLAEGGFGVLYLAEHTRLKHDPVRVIKFIRPEMFSKPTVMERFWREIQLTSAISQTNNHIVRIYDDFGEIPKLGSYYVMEFLQGESLADRLAKGSLPLHETLHVFRQICVAVQAAHKVHVVHRDLKPDNIFLLQRDSDPLFVKVLDFGIAKPLMEEEGLSLTQGAIGTPAYMPPEQSSAKEVDHRSDIYAMGTILYEMLAGYTPFLPPGTEEEGLLPIHLLIKKMTEEPPSICKRHPELQIPDELDRFIARSIARKPSDRFSSVDEMLQELFSWAGHSLPRRTQGGGGPLPSGAYIPSPGSLSGPHTLPPAEASISDPHLLPTSEPIGIAESPPLTLRISASELPPSDDPFPSLSKTPSSPRLSGPLPLPTLSDAPRSSPYAIPPPSASASPSLPSPSNLSAALASSASPAISPAAPAPSWLSANFSLLLGILLCLLLLGGIALFVFGPKPKDDAMAETPSRPLVSVNGKPQQVEPSPSHLPSVVIRQAPQPPQTPVSPQPPTNVQPPTPPPRETKAPKPFKRPRQGRKARPPLPRQATEARRVPPKNPDASSAGMLSEKTPGCGLDPEGGRWLRLEVKPFPPQLQVDGSTKSAKKGGYFCLALPFGSKITLSGNDATCTIDTKKARHLAVKLATEDGLDPGKCAIRSLK